ncbi:MAG: CoA-binding protein [Chloroflexota bacterium]
MANVYDEETKLKHRMLTEARTIAVVGLSPREDRDSHQVARYLQAHGYRVIPVNPLVEVVLGEKCYANLSAVPEPIDLVDIFRRSKDVAPVVEEAIAVGARGVWMQDGIVDPAAAARAEAAGIPVVMDDCTMRVHRRMLHAAKSRL